MNQKSFINVTSTAKPFDIKPLLQAWQADYQTLLDALLKEQKALEQRDFDALAIATQEKNLAVNQVAQHTMPELFRHQYPKTAPLSWLKHWLDTTQNDTADWPRLLQTIEQCQFQNEVNGRMVSLLDASCKRIFNLLKGSDPDNNLYDASGSRSRLSASHRSIAV